LKLNPFGAALGVLAMGALISSGCGNGSNASTANEASSTTSGLSVKVDPVAISADSVGKTTAGAWASGKGNDLVLNTMAFYKPTQTGAYPIVLATYKIVCSKYPDPQVGMAGKAFLESTIGAAQNGLADNGYVPIPDAWKLWLVAAINAIT
jgi:hypothetical protein